MQPNRVSFERSRHARLQILALSVISLTGSIVNIKTAPSAIFGGFDLAGVREARREEVRQTLSQQALRLFLERGFDQTTVDEIVEQTGVSRRTFFRHFDTKEDLVFVFYETLARDIGAACAERPEDEAPFKSACAAMRALLKYYEENPAWTSAMMKLSTQTPSLNAKSHEKRSLWEAAIVEILAPRLSGPDAEFSARLIAGIVVTAFSQAVRFWLAGKSSRSLHETVDAAFAFATKLGVDDGPRSRAARAGRRSPTVRLPTRPTVR